MRGTAEVDLIAGSARSYLSGVSTSPRVIPTPLHHRAMRTLVWEGTAMPWDSRTQSRRARASLFRSAQGSCRASQPSLRLVFSAAPFVPSGAMSQLARGEPSAALGVVCFEVHTPERTDPGQGGRRLVSAVTAASARRTDRVPRCHSSSRDAVRARRRTAG